jgi:protein SMG6
LEEKKAELEVLEMVEGKALTDGTIEDDDGDDAPKTSLSRSGSELVSRWVRIIQCGVNIAGAVDGFNWVEGSREWNVEGKLAEKVTRWQEEDQAEREEEERRLMGKRWTEDPMDVDDAEDISEESEDDENGSDEVRTLKVSRLFLKKIWVAHLFLS